MELHSTLSFSKSEIAQFGSVSSRQSLLLLPPGQKKKQKVVVGDDTGTIHCFNLRKGVVETSFKQQLTDGKVECLALGGALGSRDKVFVSAGSSVRGISNKGREYFKLDTQLTDPLRAIAVDALTGTTLHGAGDFGYYCYDNGRDAGHFMAPDRIQALCLGRVLVRADRSAASMPGASLGGAKMYGPLLGCADRMIRVLQDGLLVCEVSVEGPVTVVQQWQPPAFSAGPALGGGAGSGAGSGTQWDATRAAMQGLSRAESGRVGGAGAGAGAGAGGGGAFSALAAAATASTSAAAAAAASAPSAAPLAWFLYGTANGWVGLLAVNPHGVLQRVWSFPAPPGSPAALTNARQAAVASGSSGTGASTSQLPLSSYATAAGVTSLCVFDLCKRGWEDVVVSREDGSCEAYGIPGGADSASYSHSSASASGGPGGAAEAAIAAAAATSAGGVPVTLIPSPSPITAAAAAAAALALYSGASSSSSSATAADGSGGGNAGVSAVPHAINLLWSTCVYESVRCVAAGCVSSPDSPELFALLHSGRLLAWTTESLTEADADDAKGRSKAVVARETQLAALKKDVEELKRVVARERERLEKAGGSATTPGGSGADSPLGSGFSGSGGGGAGGAAAALAGTGESPFPMTRHEPLTSFRLNAADGTYLLNVELPVPLDYVQLQATVPLSLPDAEEEEAAAAAAAAATGAGSAGGGGGGAADDRNGAAAGLSGSRNVVVTVMDVSVVKPLPLQPASSSSSSSGASSSGSGAPVLAVAVVRCTDGANRLSVRVRPLEGAAGEVALLIVPRSGGAAKTAAVVRLPVRPLALHYPLVDRPAEVETGVHSEWLAFIDAAGRSGGGGSGGDADDDEDAAAAAAADAATATATGGGAGGSEGKREGDSTASGEGDTANSGSGASNSALAGADRRAALAAVAAAATSDAARWRAGAGGHLLRPPASPLLAHIRRELIRATGGTRAGGSASASTTAASVSGNTGGSGVGVGTLQMLMPLPFSTLAVTGAFSLAQAHEWLAAALPDMPAKPRPAVPGADAAASTGSGAGAGGITSGSASASLASGDEAAPLAYRSSLTGSHLFISYSKGNILLRSDSPTALAILKEHIVTAATALKVRVSAPTDIHPLASRRFLHLLHPSLSRLLALGSKAELVDAVRELVQSDAGAGAGTVGGGGGTLGADAASGSASGSGSGSGGAAAVPQYLHPLFSDILLHGDAYKREVLSRPRQLQLLAGVLLDAVVDCHKLATGRNVLPLLLSSSSASATAAAATGGAGGGGKLQYLLQRYLEPGGAEALAAFMERPS